MGESPGRSVGFRPSPSDLLSVGHTWGASSDIDNRAEVDPIAQGHAGWAISAAGPCHEPGPSPPFRPFRDLRKMRP